MEVRPGQHDSTIAQALAHNVNTSKGDLEMWRERLVARLQHESATQRLDTEAAIAQLDRAYEEISRAYAGLLGQFGAEVGRAHEHWQHDHGEHGHERDVSLVTAAHHDAGLARRFETR